MKRLEFRDRWVLVTGASSGLGRVMTEILVREHGARVIAVARRSEKLEELRRELGEAGARVEPLIADLSKPDDVERVLETCTRGRSLYAAILNAGVTHFGPFEDLSWASFQSMLATNVTSVVRLATALVPEIERSGDDGGVMLVASLAGVVPVPYQTAYSATKAFLVTFGAGLHHETRGRRVSITTFVPGGIATEMTEGESFKPLASWLMPVEPCAREAIDAFVKRRAAHVPGVLNRLGATLVRFAPQHFVIGRVAATYRRALAETKTRSG